MKTIITLQDYNASVLELVTLPNILLAWYMSPASLSYRSSISLDDELEHHPETDPTRPSTLPLPPALKKAFQVSLAELDIELRFFYGSWQTFHPDPQDVVLTSETIYRSDVLESLIRVLKESSKSATDEPQSEAETFGLEKKLSLNSTLRYRCLIAAKVLYFGVGGGVSDFVQSVEGKGLGKVETVWEKKVGVGRKIMNVQWS